MPWVMLIYVQTTENNYELSLRGWRQVTWVVPLLRLKIHQDLNNIKENKTMSFLAHSFGKKSALNGACSFWHS